jgi:hypothetical protein
MDQLFSVTPVRAGMVASPDEYLWSSHRGYLGIDVLPWLTTDWVLSIFSADILEARNGYLCFVADGIGETRRNEFHRGTVEGRILGDDNFTVETFSKVNLLMGLNYKLSDVINIVCLRYGITSEQLKATGKSRPYSEARAITALLVSESPRVTLTELGKMLNRDIAPLGRAGRGLLMAALQDEGLCAKIEELRRELSTK